MWCDKILKQIDEWLNDEDFLRSVSIEIIDRLLAVKKQIEKEKIITKQFNYHIFE